MVKLRILWGMNSVLASDNNIFMGYGSLSTYQEKFIPEF
jgi:hypothetical protein